jgi:Uma2 family endonuclease
MMSHPRSVLETRDDRPTEDHVVQIDGATWQDYERLLEIRGERSVPRISYLEGRVELMTPSRQHERIKSLIGCLVEAYCLHAGIHFMPYGSWTVKQQTAKSGAEPDECYVFGQADADRPHLAIEVIWTSGRLDKLEIYRRLRIDEVWYWRKGHIQPHALRGDRYEPIERSALLPGLDLELLVQCLDRPSALDAINDFRAALASRSQ